jgi:hypothetical protein
MADLGKPFKAQYQKNEKRLGLARQKLAEIRTEYTSLGGSIMLKKLSLQKECNPSEQELLTRLRKLNSKLSTIQSNTIVFLDQQNRICLQAPALIAEVFNNQAKFDQVVQIVETAKKNALVTQN